VHIQDHSLLQRKPYNGQDRNSCSVMLKTVNFIKTARRRREGFAVFLSLKFIIPFMLLFLTESIVSIPLFAATASIKPGTSTFTMSSVPITLQSIKPASELGISPTAGYASGAVQIDWIAPSADASLSADNTYSSQVPLTRTINPLWTWTFTLNNSTRPSVTVVYTVTGANGQPGVFSNSIDTSSTIAVTVIPGGVTAVNVGKASNNSWKLTDAVDISFSYVNIKNSGTYSGTVQAKVTPVNFQ
jgi:hypothetical protein